MLKKIALTLLLISITGAGAIFFAWQSLVTWAHSPLSLSFDDFVIERGQNLTQISKRLLSDEPRWKQRAAVFYASRLGLTRIKSGEYQISNTETWHQLLEKWVLGQVVVRQVTLVEGWTINQALEQLHKQERLVQTLSSIKSAELLAKLPKDNNFPEGWFFADTYSYQSGDSDLDILERAHLRMIRELDDSWQKRADNLPLASPYEGLILASIVEKETGVKSERPRIAGVFIERLRRGMRLQTDPTVIYGLGESYQGNLTRTHLRQATDYNTYVISGLPPTPIALVGKESLDAVFQPLEEDYLYFVAKGDGSHYFSKTLEEHNNAVRRYQIEKRAQNYQSSPSSQ